MEIFVEKNRAKSKRKTKKERSKFKRVLILTLILLSFSAILVASLGLTFSFLSFKDEIKSITRADIYTKLYSIPEPTFFLSKDGEIIAELFERYTEIVKFDEIPPHIVYAFLAAEDDAFFKHKSIDLKAIMRAALKNLKEMKIVQGGSTITQQLARNLFLSRERTIPRKIKEILYAIKIEKELTKEEIFSLYVSTIFFGNGSWGLKSAARNYFGKPISQLTIAEAALLASLPKSPVYYSPIKYPEKARKRQVWVLQRMKELGFISEKEYEDAIREKIKVYAWQSKFTKYFWFTEHIRRELVKMFGNDEDEIKRGYRVITTLHPECYIYAQDALRRGLERIEIINGKDFARDIREIAIRITPQVVAVSFPDGENIYELDEKIYIGKIEEVRTARNLMVRVKAREITPEEVINREFTPGEVTQKDVPHEKIISEKKGKEEQKAVEKEYKDGYIIPEIVDFRGIKNFREGDTIVLRKCDGPDKNEYFCPIPKSVDVEGAIVVLSATDGEVLCMVGGYDISKSQFIRSVQAKRQIGSAVKPLIYTAALETGLFNPATLIGDYPIIFEYKLEVGETEEWKPKDMSSFRGFVTLQEALAKSINAATVRVAHKIGLNKISETLARFGINEKVEDYTISIGSISLTPLELAAAHTPFANGGIRKEPYFIKRIEKNGDTIFEWENKEKEEDRIMSPQLAFVMTWMMRNVILHGTGQRAKVLNIPVAGKTGTSDMGRDAWFIGFTPEVVVVVWVGKDDFTTIGNIHTGAYVALPIFVNFMMKYKELLKKKDFDVPEGIEFAKIDPLTGEISSEKFYVMAFSEDNTPWSKAGTTSTDESSKIEINEIDKNTQEGGEKIGEEQRKEGKEEKEERKEKQEKKELDFWLF